MKLTLGEPNEPFHLQTFGLTPRDLASSHASLRTWQVLGGTRQAGRTGGPKAPARGVTARVHSITHIMRRIHYNPGLEQIVTIIIIFP